VTPKHKRYRVVGLSLYVNEAREADRLTEILRNGGWPKANRSLVVREALCRLSDDLAGKSDEEIFRYFLDRQLTRMKKRSDSAPLPSEGTPDGDE
jgi:hypothetical protein